MTRRAPTRLLAAALLAVAFTGAAGCRDRAPEGGPAPAPPPAKTPVAAPAHTLTYDAHDDFGDPPSAAAQANLVHVLSARLTGIGLPAASVAFPEPTRLVARFGEAPDAEARAAQAIEHEIEFRFRVRAPAEFENRERTRRDTLGDMYLVTEGFAWFPLDPRLGEGEVLLIVPEVPVVERVAAERAREPRDEKALAAAEQELGEVLLREVFGARDLCAASARHDATGSSVLVVLAEDRRAAFLEFTQHYLGKPLAVVVDGHVIAAPVLTSPLADAAEIRPPGEGFDRETADRLAEGLRRSAFGIRLERRD